MCGGSRAPERGTDKSQSSAHWLVGLQQLSLLSAALPPPHRVHCDISAKVFMGTSDSSVGLKDMSRTYEIFGQKV